jgi:photosystem II stability/assembly factor-like uncharacterized protein
VTRRSLLVVLPLLIAVAAALLVVRPLARDGEASAACPPGTTTREAREHQERREQLGRRAYPDAAPSAENEEAAERATEQEREKAGATPECLPRKHPESKVELLAIQAESSRRAASPFGAVKPGAYRAALRQRGQIAQAGRTIPGAGGTWTPVGTTPLINDDPNYPEVSGVGFADVAGRISAFATDTAHNRVYAAIGEGGVYRTEDGGAHWTSVGDGLPTQAVGGIGWTPAGGADGTIVVTTGDNVFGGGGTFAGMGAFRSTDGGRTWQQSTGIPDNVISFKVAVDPSDPMVVYAATGAGLFRSPDAGATFQNVALPVSASAAPGQPDCTGAPPTKEGCFLANMVTDVIVAPADNATTPDGSPAAKPGAVVAAVGWRAADKQSPPSKSYPDGYVESPGNGIYRSDTGAPGSFQRLAATGFPSEHRAGRTELDVANGPAQDHNHLYAVVEDAVRFNGGTPVIDVPNDQVTPLPNATTLAGIYVSKDLGATWTQMTTPEELADPTTGSALAGVGCALLYCPGVQAWYDQFISVDPTRQDASGVPTRLVFGLEEVWQNRNTSQPQDGKSSFKVIGPYFSGDTCQFLNGIPVCPTTSGDPTAANTTTHPDQHAGQFLPASDGGVTLMVGNDGGTYAQSVTAPAGSDPEFSADRWGRGANGGFHTLLPYDAQVARDDTIYSGLQDNGEMKVEPSGRQVAIYGGDGGYSAVDPDNSRIAYEEYVYADMRVTKDGGHSWKSMPPPDDTYQFINPFAMDPTDARHLLTAGTSVYETTDGPDTSDWTTVFDLGTRTQPGDPNASADTDDPDNLVSAVDVRGDAAYVAYCGYCDALNRRPFASGLAANVTPDGKVGKRKTADNWHIAKGDGLPDRYITSVQMDPANPRTVFVTLGGYSRRWLPVGVLGEKEADLRAGNVWRSDDAGDTFRNVSGNLPDAPANFTLLRNGRLIVATNTGIFISGDAAGANYEVLGSGLPAAPAFSLELKPGDGDTLVAATQGRGIYRYAFTDPTPATPAPTATRTPGTTPSACKAAVTGFKSAKATPRGRRLGVSFTRSIHRPVTVDVFQHSVGRRVVGERLVARYANRSRSFVWNGRANRRHRRVADGFYSVRMTMNLPSGAKDVMRLALERRGGRWARRPAFQRRDDSCATLSSFKLERPVFGGTGLRKLSISYRLNAPARVSVEVRRGTRLARRFATSDAKAKTIHRLPLAAKGRPRGVYSVRITVTRGKERTVATLAARRL